MDKSLSILLISPPDRNLIFGTLPAPIERQRGFIPPLGLLYIGSYLKAKTSHRVRVLDAPVMRLDYKSLGNEISGFGPDVVGIQAMTLSIIDVLLAARLVKEINPRTKVALGGPHAGLFTTECLGFDCIDAVFVGEGERSFAQWCDATAQGRETDLGSIPGLALKTEDGLIKSTPPELIENLDDLPMPDRRLTPWKGYYSFLAASAPFSTMMTSRGCPFRCMFCARPHLGKKFRPHSPQRVVDEMQDCLSLGIREIFFHDDTFTMDRNRVMAVCGLIQERKISIPWSARTRVDMVDEELLSRMKKAGARRIHFGVESGSQKVLDVLRKDITLDQAREAFRLARKFRIAPLADFMIGSPDEGEEEIRRTIAFARELDPDWVQFSITTIYPGTPMHERAVDLGLVDRDLWSRFARNPSPGFVPPVWDRNLNRKQITAWERRAYRSFYLRPRYVIRRLLSLRSPADLWRKFRAALKIFKL